MKLLIVCATRAEFCFLPLEENKTFYFFKVRDNEVDVLVTGVGMMATAYFLSEALNNKKYELVINAGIAGSFKRNLSLGEVVNVTSEMQGDFGAEDDTKFLDAFDLTLVKPDEFPYTNKKIISEPLLNSSVLKYIKKVSAITVNKAHGNEQSINTIVLKYNADVESMEGAACFFVCAHKKTKCVQIRAISNYIEKRERENWNIPLAIRNLNSFLEKFINEL